MLQFITLCTCLYQTVTDNDEACWLYGEHFTHGARERDSRGKQQQPSWGSIERYEKYQLHNQNVSSHSITTCK